MPQELATVARHFIQLQQHRHTADYDSSKSWSREEVLDIVILATDAFGAWQAIRNQAVAEDFLLQLFLPKLPRP